MRREFTKPTKREALKRSGGKCEATGGHFYTNLDEGQRCGIDLGKGVHFDHVDLDANSKDNSLANCAAICPRCHAWKTRTLDIPKAAKTVRQQDKDNGITRPRKKIQSRPFQKSDRRKALYLRGVEE